MFSFSGYAMQIETTTEIRMITPAEVAAAFTPAMLDEDACRVWLIHVTRGDELCCPYCGGLFDLLTSQKLYAGNRVQCSACERHSSPRTGTFLEGSTLSNAQFVFILALLEWEIPVSTIAKMAGCGVRTVYDWRQRLGGVQQ
jgi:transposase-like protein